MKHGKNKNPRRRMTQGKIERKAAKRLGVLERGHAFGRMSVPKRTRIVNWTIPISEDSVE